MNRPIEVLAKPPLDHTASEPIYSPMSEPTPSTLRIDIVSDVVCPWCIVGYKQLEAALVMTETRASIHWHPFELNPQMAEVGENLADHLAAKYGTTPADGQQNRARLTALGAEVGFVFDFADDMRMHNTFRAHQLLHWARVQRRQHDLKMALFAAHFTDRRNIDDAAVLADVAAAIGLDHAEATAVLADQRHADEVREERDAWAARGITGVPSVIFDQRHLLVGAQGVNRYAMALQRLAEASAA